MRINLKTPRITISEIIEQSQSIYDRTALEPDEYKIKLRDQLSQSTRELLDSDELQHIADILESYEEMLLRREKKHQKPFDTFPP